MLKELLQEIEEFGKRNDEQQTEKELRMRNISRTTGEFISFLIRISGVERVLEIGTSNGYSTLFIADALSKNNGKVTTVEFLPSKRELAKANFEKSGLASFIEQEQGDAGNFLKNVSDQTYDLVLLDSDRKEYVNWWNDLKRVIRRPKGVMLIDNALSHQEELSDFVQLVKETEGCETIILPFDKGVMMVKF